MNSKNDKMCNIFENDRNYVISGGSEDDRNSGDAGNEEQVGDLGNEVLYGGNKDDKLAGDSVNDILHGEGGINTLTGGPGKDRFYCGPNGDTITDFTVGEDNKFGNCIVSSTARGGYNYGPSLSLSGPN
jgi:Ca2+-binding RTX toxin-like protein